MKFVCIFNIYFIYLVLGDVASREIYLDDENTVTWSPTSEEDVTVEAPLGCKISLNVTVCDLSGTDGEFVTINIGSEDNNGLIFSYVLSTKPSYLFSNNKLYGQFSAASPSRFTAIFKRVGEPYTTVSTEEPTTPIILPTPSINDSHAILVHIYGKAANEYQDEAVLNIFKDAVVRMASQYCLNENFPLNGTITKNNVIVEDLEACPIAWPDYKTCVSISFSVPVNLRTDVESQWNGYQISEAHLNIMWARLATTYLAETGLSLYSVPNIDRILEWRIVVICIVIVIFVVLLLLLRHFGIKFSNKRRRKLSDTASIMSSNDRNSQLSLPPHYLQDTPALFENAYPMYNPGKGPAFSEPRYNEYNNFDTNEEQQNNKKEKINDNNRNVESDIEEFKFDLDNEYNNFDTNEEQQNNEKEKINDIGIGNAESDIEESGA